jgi:hypothetical protein
MLNEQIGEVLNNYKEWCTFYDCWCDNVQEFTADKHICDIECENCRYVQNRISISNQ